jgi:arylsulfatase A-like enzyme
VKSLGSFCSLAYLLALPLLGACRHAPAPPDILMIVVDTLRADRLGAYGSTRGLTPFLDDLATKATVFRNAYAASSWTPPSVASLFTSRYPSQHRVVMSTSKLSDSETTLAETLASGHYTTAGFSANVRLTAALGFAQGFDVWVHHPEGPIKPRGSILRHEGLEWIDGTCAARRPAPCFLFLQYMEPHAPYQPQEPYRSRFGRTGPDTPDIDAANQKLLTFALSQISDAEADLLESYYDAEVASVDAELQLLFSELQRRHFLDHAIVVITADHGEEFKDHGWFSHGTSLYNETVHVPLIVLTPGPRRVALVDDNVSLVDVAPTLLALAGLPPEPRFEGHSLAALLSDPRSDGRDAPRILLELERTNTPIDFRRQTAGIIDGHAKLLVNDTYKTSEVFDLAVDPHELAPQKSGSDTVLTQALAAAEATLGRRVAAGEQRSLDEGTKEKLRALGYGSDVR